MKIPDLIALSELDFVTELDQIKAEIDARRPLPKATEERIMQKLRLDWNYHSNAIEGNQLDYGETVAFLMHGITAKGKTLKDHLDIKGHNEAIHLLLSIVKEARGFSEVDIRTLHKMILVEPYESNAIMPDGLPTKKQISLGEYKKMPNSVKTRTGEMHNYASPEDTPIKMAELMAWYNEAKENSEVHALVLAAVFHHEFVAIHPFDDGNGRMGRILMNLILLQRNFPVIVVKKEDRNNYYGVLSQADNGLYIPLVNNLAGLLKHSLDIYLKGAKGEEIEEKDDIDKEIALFKQGLKGVNKENYKNKNHEEVFKSFINNVIFPLANYLVLKSEQLNEIFLENKLSILIPIGNTQIKQENVVSLLEMNEKSKGIFINYSHKGLLNNNKKLIINTLIDIKFRKDVCNISNVKSKIIFKYYHESWLPNEMENFVNGIIKDTMQEIQEKISKNK